MSNSSARTRRVRIRHAGVVVALAAGLSVSATSVASASPTPHVQLPAAVNVVGLRKGSYGDAVRALQQALVQAGVGVVGGVDGFFGSATESSVRFVQRQHGLTVNGVVSERTAAALGLEGAPAATLRRARDDHADVRAFPQ